MAQDQPIMNPQETGQRLVEEQLRQEGGQQPLGQEDFLAANLQVYYLIEDEKVIQYMSEDPQLQPLIPMFSRMNRTSNMDKTTIQINKIRGTIALRLQLLVNQKPDLVSLGKFYALRNYLDGVCEDTREGWRGRLSTEKIKTYRIESGERKKSFLGLRR